MSSLVQNDQACFSCGRATSRLAVCCQQGLYGAPIAVRQPHNAVVSAVSLKRKELSINILWTCVILSQHPDGVCRNCGSLRTPLGLKRRCAMFQNPGVSWTPLQLSSEYEHEARALPVVLVCSAHHGPDAQEIAQESASPIRPSFNHQLDIAMTSGSIFRTPCATCLYILRSQAKVYAS